MSETNEIQTLIDTYREAVISKDVEKIMALYADDIVSYDAVKALQFQRQGRLPRALAGVHGNVPGPAHVRLRSHEHRGRCQHIAFAHWLAHCGGTNEKGETQACWMRVTACYRREAGQWRIVHEHWSAPFDMMSGTTLFDLEP